MLLLQLQFGQIKAALAGIGCARAVAVAVAVLADPGCSGEVGEFQDQPRPGPCSFHSVWLEKRDWQVTQLQFQQAQLVLAGIGGTRVVVVAVAVAVWTDPGSSARDRMCQGCSFGRSRLLWGRRRNPGPAQVRPRSGPCGFHCVWLGRAGDCQATQVQFQ